MNLFFDFEKVNLLLKNNGGKNRRPNFDYGSLECFEYRRLGGGGLRQRVLFRTG